MIDDQLPFPHRVAAVSHLCDLALYIIRRIILYLKHCATQLLGRAMFIYRLGALLAGLPACRAKPLTDGAEHGDAFGVSSTPLATHG